MVNKLSLCLIENPVHPFKDVGVEVELFNTKKNYNLVQKPKTKYEI